MTARAPALRAADFEQRLRAIAEVAAADTAADADEVEALVDCLGHERKIVQRRAAEALAALERSGLPVRAALAAAAAGADPRRRWGAAFALSLLEGEPEEALPAAFEALGSRDGDVRWAAAAIVVRVGRERRGVAERLLDIVAEGGAEPRKMALYCLRDLGGGDGRVRAVAAAATEDADEGVALAALSLLVRLAPGEAEAVGAALRMLAGANPRLQRAAASALGALAAGGGEVRAILERAAAGTDPSLRRAAERALRQIAPV